MFDAAVVILEHALKLSPLPLEQYELQLWIAQVCC